MTQDLKDPTENVRNLMSQELRRIDDLMHAEQKRVNEQLQLRSDYASKLDEAEAKRIDAIRAVDVGAVASNPITLPCT